MAFRKLHLFNVALVAKQTWRVLTCQNSLVARLYKAKYFSNTHMFDAPLGPNHSYIWRSVREALTLVKSGAWWRVGSGNGIKIWKDPWFLNARDPYIQTPIIPELENAEVCSLRATGDSKWDQDLLNYLFVARDVEMIKVAPISVRVVENRGMWYPDRKVLFSTKNGYRVLHPSPSLQHQTMDPSSVIRGLCIRER